MSIKDKIREMPCCNCGSRPSDPAHIKTKGSGGPDELFNLMPLCRICHSEQHKIGIITFVNKHPNVKKYLESIGWEIGRKLWHPKTTRL